jgi:PAS domain S-box-containing protein
VSSRARVGAEPGRLRAGRRANHDAEFLRALLLNSPLAIVVLDAQQCVELVNPAFELMFGYRQAEIAGSKLDEFIAPAEKTAEAVDFTRRILRGETVHTTTVRQRRDGTRVEVELYGVPLLAGGQLVGVYALYQDLTERRRAEAERAESVRRVATVLDSITDSFFAVDPEWRFTYLNARANEYLRRLGKSRDTLIGKNLWEEFPPPPGAPTPNPLLRAMREQVPVEYEVYYPPLETWFEIHAYPSREGLSVYVRDITERKQAEEEVARRTAYWRALIEANPLAIVVLDDKHRVQLCNPAFEKLFGYALKEIAGMNLDDFIAPTGKGSEAVGFTRQVLSGEAIHACTRRRRKDGQLVEVEILGVPLIIEGRLLGVYGIYQDITERKHAEEERRRSEERFLLVAQATNDAVWDWDLETNQVWWNEGLRTLFGFPPGAVSSDAGWWSDHIHPEDRERILQGLNAVLAEGGRLWTDEYRFRRADGSYAYVFDRGYVLLGEDGKPARMIGAMMDITDRQLAEAALRESETKFRALTETVACAIFISRGDRFLYVNPETEAVSGYSRDELLAMEFWQLIHPDNRELVRERRTRRLRGEPAPQRYEFKILTKSGEVRWIDFTATVINYEGQPAVLGTAFDITGRKQTEEALGRSEASYRSLVEGSPYGIYRSTLEGQLLMANPALVRMLGYSSEDELQQLNLARDVYRRPEERPRLIEQYGSLERAEGVEVEWKRKDGTPIWVRLSGRPVRGPEGNIRQFEMVCEDVTERRRLGEQLRQAQKMEAVGRLAGGIAHDFNNLLMLIRGYSELLRDRLTDEAARSYAAEVQGAADRATALIQQLLAFSRKQVLELQVLDLNETLAGMERLLPRVLGENIEVAVRRAAGLGRVKADPVQIEQVLMNLALNARDAMPRGGRLTVESSNVDVDESGARRHAGLRPGSYVMLGVSDTGVGMDTEVQSRLFEPFFTTKEKSKGTGLGLATVYGIVKQSGGYIAVYSEVGRGSTFKVYLPRVDEPVPAARPAAPARTWSGSETVLVVEDQDGVRKLAREFLEMQGYTVLESRNGVEALALAQQHAGPIHLVLTDVVMPQMSGRELAEKLAALRPRVKVLYMSGYTDEAIVQHGVLEPGTAFLQKPYARDTLARKVREVLESR